MPVKFNRGKSPPITPMARAIKAKNKEMEKRSRVKVAQIRANRIEGKDKTGYRTVGPKWLDKKKQSRRGTVDDMLRY